MVRNRRRSRLAALLALVIGTALLLQACSDADPVESSQSSASSSVDSETAEDASADSSADITPTEQATNVQTDLVSFGETVAPILEQKCAICHNTGGAGSPHMVLETADDAAAMAPFIGDRVARKEMPPWPAGPLSVAFHNDRSLDPEQLSALLSWVETGGELDVDPDMAITAPDGVGELGEVDAELAPAEPYDGSPEIEDDYRCLVYDPTLTEDTWLTGYEFVPDQTEVVHHAIGYLIPGELADRAVAADDSDPGPGWECYGSSGLGQDEIIIGWAPGQEATNFSEGAGLLLEAGDFFVVQIHYHYDVDAPADSSLLRFDYTDGAEPLDHIQIGEFVAPAEIPCSSDETGPLCDRDAAIAHARERFGPEGVLADRINLVCRVRPEDFAGMTDGIASSSCDLPAYISGEILAILGHEHEIGASFRLTLNPGRDDELILLDIPDWDFDWQYNYAPVEAIEIGPGDTLRIECSWDRSRRDPDLDPAYIVWADGTNDEMCFSTIAVRES